MFWRLLSGQSHVVAQALARLDLGVTIEEPDVSLTDLGLAVETALFAAILARQATRWPRLRGWAMAFFGSAAAASLAGAIDHAFLRRDGRETAHDIMWAASLIAIGTTALALVGLGAELGLNQRAARRLIGVAAVATAIYALVVILVWNEFLVAILAYAPAAIFLLVVLMRRYVSLRDRASLLGIVAVLLAFAAAGIQQLEIAIHDRYFDHNALYHLVQAAAFGLFFVTIRHFLAEPDTATRPAS